MIGYDTSLLKASGKIAKNTRKIDKLQNPVGMETPITITKKLEPQKILSQHDILVKSSNIPRLLSFTVDGARSRSLSLRRDIAGFEKREKHFDSDKKKYEFKKDDKRRERRRSRDAKKGPEVQTCIPVRDRGKQLFRGKLPEKKRKNREYQDLRSKFNTSAGNILKDWMNLIYCVLVLRMNLIKLILEQISHCGSAEINFQKQILTESKKIYDVIKGAQLFSQEQFLFVWKELERLLFSYIMLKNSMDNKKQMLAKIQSDMNRLKISQNELLQSYTHKIESLKNQIEEKEKEIKEEKEENKKIRTDLAEWFGDTEEE